MLAPQSQLILRNIDRLPAGDLLLLNPPTDDLARELAVRSELRPVLFTQDFAVARALTAQRLPVEFGAVPTGNSRFNSALVFHPKEKALTDFLLFMARAHLHDGGTLWLVGENNGGIRNSGKRLRDAGIDVEKIDSARHCQLIVMMPKTTGTAFALEDWLEVVALENGGNNNDTLAVAALPGVFSAGRIDEGTALLLEALADISSGRVLDMGCGAGIVGAWLKKRHNKLDIEMVDSNAMAMAASEWTLRENNLAAKLYASDGFSEVKGTFNWIVSNPPFHDGIATDYSFTEKFIAEAKQFLRPGGRLRLVANAHLKYVPAIEAAFGNCRELAQTARFRVYEAVRR